MASSNVYAKQYSNRRPINESEQYKLILFPADNSIAVVKSKQCSAAEHDGFLHVQSGRRKFTGVVLEEEPVSTISTLNKIPFTSISHTSNTSSSSSTTTMTQSHSSSEQLNSHHDSCQNPNLVEVSDVSLAKELPLSRGDVTLTELGNANKSNKRHERKTTTSKNKRQKQSHKENTFDVSFDDVNDQEITSNEDSDEESENNQTHIHRNRSSNGDTPTFVGHRVISGVSESVCRPKVSSMFQQLLGITSKLESQYLRPLLVAQERSESIIKCLFNNQKKIEKVLRKQKMNILLTDPNEPSPPADDQTFLTSLEYTTSNGVTIDLLKHPGVKEHANRYVTSLMDILYKPEDLLHLKTVDVTKDERYLLLKEAVRNKFRLNQEDFETIWLWLHTVFLAKRRTLYAKKKKMSNDTITD